MRIATMFFAAMLMCGAAGFFGPRVQAAYKQGEIVVTVQRAPLKVDNQTVDTVSPGFCLVVQAVQNDWLWVSNGHPGWLRSSNVVPLDQAVQHFTDAIRREPRNANHYAARANVWSEKKEYEIAVSDCNEAIRLAPSDGANYGNRANVFMLMRDYDRAIADLTEVIKLGFHQRIAYNNRACAFARSGDYASALADYNTAIQLDPDYLRALSGLAGLLACCPDARFRDGKKAVDYATKACEKGRWLNARHLYSLACACAETGDFEKAERWARHAIEINPSSRESNRQAYEKALLLFKAGQPLHEVLEIEL